MLVLPAIDLLDNEAVRLLQGDYSKKTVYSSSPEKMIQVFEEQGATLIHIVDLNAAKTGKSENEKTIKKIKEKCTVDLELGGGIRTIDNMKFYDGLGVSRLILGTVAVEEPNVVEKAVSLFGQDRIVIGVDAKNGYVRTKGWESNSGILYKDFLTTMYGMGIRHVIFTDIARDGMMEGPNTLAYAELLETFPDLQLVASGGVSSKEDLVELYDKTNGKLFGAITGKAIYEGKLDLKESIRILNQKREK
ncbi:1-(5-phosphoribosyl)-5-[(5- phosphoribosylamino)methylideneamino] imidazole-4- carboxamide isomerase [Leptospira biflexa serovar Patoc strain 'Patoc 1 (Ames)']|jgi:phosphoribosylformimino-5-aminoimidazole carboxamide ribotide isomerase|uniref:1-(5-phosphoribosyl)-5-[(5-phosphoribosylamino)methylideneamino] imidazole-4-carboxamide isomerase n=2 Tax=Leptospira biflexa serovar Patoc TaxID=145259 RepID=HIS4_LEPBP|nr:1-(5-phosphoribosyl)-5-[(5-phosphoribosylamino)methylideneamino]imidazole-4-carboxamide isomerase [Leptospira biflexa]B0SDS6.1 RecName: Full=1-(5-phosphoribosyl)-5-[(5-phosphoribosylamino)methylideneamino] imidazole-4-carboxamide isomerase; AltName: Full=Phosphoribosylformimino-5-aminoimidazole carboxamide ribotide isomerase [Leptospira biflexa serovar Patoc strain 'Patoc 1 (Ames)']B0SLU9.1 RecName: Full=1-(5-phosphoribosyl)-5-[(5-phosphoribosylamino)methylideneamino] imidazole-4-carboxamide i